MNEMELFVKSLYGKTYTVYISTDKTYGDLLSQLCNKYNVQFKSIILGRKIQSLNTVIGVDIVKFACIYVV